jgi:hypothetical protein
MSALSTFPSSYSIPPPCFYTMGGLATFLNQNPKYKEYFLGDTEISNDLLVPTSSLIQQGYNVEKVPLPLVVTNLSQSQSLLYQRQLDLFRKVYAYNSNAYVNYLSTEINRQNYIKKNKKIPPGNLEGPIYFRFQTYHDYMNYRSSVLLVNKLYPFQKMAYAKNPAGSTLAWIVPFPTLEGN